MAIAASKLGQLVAENWHSADALLRALRDKRLVDDDFSDQTLQAIISLVTDEHAALPPGHREFNSPNERFRVFVGPHLTRKGVKWAVPLKSLSLKDRDGVRAWWKFWG